MPNMLTDVLPSRPKDTRYLMWDRLAWHELIRIREAHWFNKNDREVER